MNHRRTLTATVLSSVTVLLLATVSTAGQAPKPTYDPPKTPWGEPDIQGTYDYQMYIPLERPLQWEGKKTVTEADVIAWRKLIHQEGPGDKGGDWTPRNWVADDRPALVIDPPSGKIPLSAEGARKYLGLEEHRRLHQLAYETWEEIGTYEQCISRVQPRLYQGYNSGVTIAQSPGLVAILYEQLDTRFIYTDGRPALDANVRQYNGYSSGHWEGSTLVIDWTNHTDKQTGWPPMRNHGGPDDQLGQTGVPRGNAKMTERFKPVAANMLEYYVTTDDPTYYTQPWTAMIKWRKEPGYVMYEYACTEGNIGPENALRGMRLKEKSGEFYIPPSEPGGDHELGEGGADYRKEIPRLPRP